VETMSGLRRPFGALLLVFVVLVFLELPGSYLLEPDEARYAEIPREMLETGDWVTPRINRQIYFEKPPLFYWANAASLRLFGESSYAARLVSRLSALAVAGMLLFAMGRRGAPGEGRLAALIYLSSLLPFLLARLNLIDGFLTAAMTACLLSLYEFTARRERGESGFRWLLAACLAAAAGTLAKGLVGAALPALIFSAWALLTGRARRIREAFGSPATILFFVLVVPWFGAMERANPGFQKFFLLNEHFGRFLGGAKRSQFILYFVPVFLAGFLPWTFFLPRLFRRFRPFTFQRLRERSEETYFLLWAAIVFLFFTFSRSKLVPYILPMFPPLAALSAKAFLAEPPQKLRAVLRAAVLAAAGFFFLVLLQPRATRDFTAHPFVEAVRRYRVPGSWFVTYHTYLHGLPWELKWPVPMASWVGELRPAYERNGEHPLFWQEPTFWYRWNRGDKLIVLTRARDAGEFRLRSAVPFTHLLTVKEHVLLANYTAP